MRVVLGNIKGFILGSLISLFLWVLIFATYYLLT